jgi:hypothetical protein
MIPTESQRLASLPNHWSRRVGSAIVHAVLMATIAFTVARTRADHHFDARVRHQAEVHGLQREVSLLREEARIKDARMECVAPQATRTSNPKSFSGDNGTTRLLATRWPAREFARESPGHLRRRSSKRWLNGIWDYARRALRSPTESGRRGNRIDLWRGTPTGGGRRRQRWVQRGEGVPSVMQLRRIPRGVQRLLLAVRRHD